jgi:hypothetical protein
MTSTSTSASSSSSSRWTLCNRWPPSTSHPYVVVPTTDLYRKFASQIPSTAVAVEIGCCNGFCTQRLLERVSSPEQVLGMDIGPKFIRECQEKFPYVQFERINVLMEWTRAQQLIETKLRQSFPDATRSDSQNSLHIYVDIGGNREVESLLALLQALQDRLHPASLIVKSKALVAFGEKHGLDSENAWKNLQLLAQSALIQRRQNTDDLKTQTKKKYHPLKLPQRYNAQGIAICRYHNYDVDKGCLLFNDTNNHGKKCPLDHEHCHSCLETGHVAWQCPTQQEPLLEALLL